MMDTRRELLSIIDARAMAPPALLAAPDLLAAPGGDDAWIDIPEEDELSDLVAGFGDGVYIVDGDGIIRYANDRASALLGWPVSELIGANANLLFHRCRPDGSPHPWGDCPVCATLRDQTPRTDVTEVLGRHDGSELEVTLSVAALAGGGAVVTFRNTRHVRAMAERLRGSERRLRHILDVSPMAMGIITIPGFELVYGNPRLAELTGYTADGRPWIDPLALMGDGPVCDALWESLRAGGRVTDREVPWPRRDGSTAWTMLSMTAVIYDGAEALLFWAYDMTREHRTREELALQALEDPLTGLSNRRHFDARLRGAVERAELTGDAAVLLYLDLDGFKAVNDQMGHEFGDRVLRAVARRLRNGIRRESMVARIGGDEFVVIAEGLATVGIAESIAKGIVTLFNRPFSRLDEAGMGTHQGIALSVSIGIAAIDGSGADPSLILRHADEAMFEAKRKVAGSGYQFYRGGA